MREGSEAQRISDAAGRGGKSGRSESGKKKKKQQKKLAAEDEFKDKMAQRTDRNAPLYIIGADLDTRHSDLLKKDQKKNNQRCTNS